MARCGADHARDDLIKRCAVTVLVVLAFGCNRLNHPLGATKTSDPEPSARVPMPSPLTAQR